MASEVSARLRSAGALGTSADPSAIEAAVAALADVEPKVRAAGAESLAELASRGVANAASVGPLATALRDPSAEVREAAARALSALADRNTMSPEAIGPLVAALDDGQAATRRSAAAALGRLGRLGPSARRTVWAALSNKALSDGDGEVRKIAAEALAALHEAPVITAVDRVEELRKALIHLPQEAATSRLCALGRSLEGEPLRRASWAAIARAIRDPHAGDTVLRIVATATSREHALHALRLARASRVNRGPRTKVPAPAGAPATVKHLPAIDQEHEHEHSEGYHEDMDWPYSNRPSFVESRSKAHQRLAGVVPASALAAAVEETTSRALSQQPFASFTALRARTDDATFARLVKLVGGVRASDAETTELSERLGIPERAASFHDGQRPEVKTAIELGLVCLLEERRDTTVPADVDWPSVCASLSEELSRPPPPDGLRLAALLRAALRFVLRAPPRQLSEILRAAPQAHKEYAPVWLWSQLRAGGSVNDMADRAHMAIGSALAIHHVRRNVGDVHRARGVDVRHGYGWRDGLVPELLLSGALTLRRMDYPAFHLVVRPSISIVPADLLAELVELTENLLWKNELLATGTFDTVLTKLFEDAGSTAYRRLPDEARRSLTTALEEHAIAYVVLKTAVFADEPIRIRRKHVRSFAGRRDSLEEAPPPSFAELRRIHGHDLAREGLCHALLGELHERWTDDPSLSGALKEGFIAVLRSVATTHGQGGVDPGTDTEEPALRAVRLAQFVQARLVDALFEVSVALGLDGGQGLPRLSGGRLPEVELRFRRVMRKLSGAVRTVSGAEERRIECRPISKLEAVHRSDLGDDCSSSHVPFRALSPHHVYYGLFEGGEQKAGYMTVYEAWAELPDGKRAAVLCLETINVPGGAPDSALLDLVRIFESIAAQRGLHPGLVLITQIGTWNYQSGPLLEQSRRFRRGVPVALHPADPITWRLYELIAPEARSYSAFNVTRTGAFRLLAPFDPDLDFVQPENEEEAARLRSSGDRELVVTARSAEGPVGFISELPDIL